MKPCDCRCGRAASRPPSVGPSPVVFDEIAQVGYIDFPTDNDGFVCRLETGTHGVPAFALAAAKLYDPDCCRSAAEQVRRPQLVNFPAPPGTNATVSYCRAQGPRRR